MTCHRHLQHPLSLNRIPQSTIARRSPSNTLLNMDLIDFMSVGVEKKKHCSGPDEAGFYINLSLSLYVLLLLSLPLCRPLMTGRADVLRQLYSRRYPRLILTTTLSHHRARHFRRYIAILYPPGSYLRDMRLCQYPGSPSIES